MSTGQEGPPGPGYWKATDGNWYPPEQHPDYQPPAAPPPPKASEQARPQRAAHQQSAAESRADAKAEKARAKALRPWYKKKRFIIPLALGVLIVIMVAASGGGDDDKNTDVTSNDDNGSEVTDAPSSGVSYPDQQKDDHVAGPDGKVELSGFTTTASALRKVNAEFGEDEVCSDVTILNRDSKSQDYNVLDFKLQTPSGDVKSFELTNSTLGSGQLVSGGTKSGTVCFTDPKEPGQYVFIWKPDAFNADRGIWLFTL